MSLRSLTAAITLYRSGTLTLDQAARRSGVGRSKLAAELRSRGIRVREDTAAETVEPAPT